MLVLGLLGDALPVAPLAAKLWSSMVASTPALVAKLASLPLGQRFKVLQTALLFPSLCRPRGPRRRHVSRACRYFRWSRWA